MLKDKGKNRIKLSIADKFISYRKVCQINQYKLAREESESFKSSGKVRIVAAIKSKEELYVI